jgi:hypothetical protein
LFTMPQNKDLKRLVRARMAETGENYTRALARVRAAGTGERLDPLPPAWRLTGSHHRDYEVGLLPGVVRDGHRVAQLRLGPEVSQPSGFGALMQSIAAARYLGRRIRYRGLLRAGQVTGWGGLWLRVDGTRGPLLLDNMQDRPVRLSTDWTEASIVLDVPGDAESLHFGMLLSGGGALDLARPEFEEAPATVPVTVTAGQRAALPDEPQALDF